MYNKIVIDELIKFIALNDGIADKSILLDRVQKKFKLVKDRSVYYCSNFAIRFSQATSKNMSNTVLSLSSLQKYDREPVFVCIVTPQKNYLKLMNATFIKKVSHSSQQLRIDNIKGSINGSDIVNDFNGVANIPQNFRALFAFHQEIPFEDNLERLVETTNNIVGRVQKFIIGNIEEHVILDSVRRAKNFINSGDYVDLERDLNERVAKVEGEIAIAATYIDNVNIRGRVIEYLITDSGSAIKKALVKALREGTPIPSFKTADDLGDYSKDYSEFCTKTDIKTKVLYYDGNPKAYNIDKLLKFLATKKSVYMIYLLGISEENSIIARLISVFDGRLIKSTRTIFHWAGRNSRGVAQFEGEGLKNILLEPIKPQVDKKLALNFLEDLIRK